MGLITSLKLDSNHWFFSPYDLEIRWMTSKNNRPLLLVYIKLCALFQTSSEFKLELQSGNIQFRSKLGDFFVIMSDLEIWQMTLKNNRAPLLCYFKFCSSFIATGEFKLELQSGNTKFGWKSAICCPLWPWKTIGHLFLPTSSLVHHFVAICLSKLELRSRNAQFGSKSAIFCPHLEIWQTTLKTFGHLSYATSSFVHHFITISEYNLELVFDLCDLDLWLLTLIYCMDITSVNGNPSLKFHDDMMMGT